MARQLTNAKPKNMKKTLSSFKKYIGNHKYAFVFIGCYLCLLFAKQRTIILKKLSLFATTLLFAYTLSEEFRKKHRSYFPILSIDTIFHFRRFYLSLYQTCFFQLFQMLWNRRFRDGEFFVNISEKTAILLG